MKTLRFFFALALCLFANTASAATAITSVTGPAGGTNLTGQKLNFTVNFSASVTVTGTPQLPLTIGASPRNATYVSGSPGTALVFSYTVQGSDSDMDGIASTSPLALNSGTIKDAGANNATLTFTPPTMTTVRVGVQRQMSVEMNIYVRPGGTSYSWVFYDGNAGTGPFTPVLDVAIFSVPALSWNLTRGQAQYSSNGGASWTSVNLATPTYVTVAGKIWRFVDTMASDTTTYNSYGFGWHLVATPGTTIGSGRTVYPDNAPTDLTTSKNIVFSTASPGDTIATATPTDTGDTRGGYWVIDSQSVPNLFTITFDPTTGNTATLKLGTGTIPAIGQVPTVTLRYYDVYQTDSSGLPLAGQGFSKTIPMTVVSEVSSDLSLGNDVPVNTYTTDSQSAPAAAKLSDGNMVVVWQSAGQGRSSKTYNSIRGQLLSGTGTKVGSEFLVSNSGTTTDDILPAVAALNSGRYVVAYATKSATARAVSRNAIRSTRL